MEIKTSNGHERFAVSNDTDCQDKPIVVFLWVPDTGHHEHDHIQISLDEAKKLRTWLLQNIED